MELIGCGICVQVKAVAAGAEIVSGAPQKMPRIDLRCRKLLDFHLKAGALRINDVILIANVLCGYDIGIVAGGDPLAERALKTFSVFGQRIHYIFDRVRLILDINREMLDVLP